MFEAMLRVLLWLAFGEVLARVLGVPVPGSILGLLGLYCDMARGGAVPEPLGRLAGGLLPNMGVLFVPAGAGVFAHLGLLRAELLPILAAVFGGTLVGIAVTALAVDRLAAWEARRGTRAALGAEAAHGPA
jgi:holin-like protein